jgi:hypothetical protein
MSGQKSVTYLGKYTEENLNRELRKHASVARITDVDGRKKPSQNTDWVESLRTKKITELVVAHAKKSRLRSKTETSIAPKAPKMMGVRCTPCIAIHCSTG